MNRLLKVGTIKKLQISTRMIANDGKMYTKAERVEHMKATPHPELFAFENRRLRVYGNTAVVNTDLLTKGSGREEETHVTTFVLVKQKGKWRLVNIQGTRRVNNK
jgi:ketosteroid isomerase-like protein